MEKKVLRNLSYGVYIVGCNDKDKYVGCTINSAVQITSTPTTISISLHHDNYTNECIKKSGTFSLSIIKENSNPEIISTFGYSSSKEVNKFENFEFEVVNNLPILKDSCGNLTCEVINTIETETHTIFIGKVTNFLNYTDDEPMTYRYYQQKLKGKSPKNAPTYVEEKNKKGWRCPVCGYVYENEEIPEGYRCPICGVEGSIFQKIET